MFEGDLRHLGGKECCSYFMSFESMGGGSKDGRCICALFEQQLSCIITASCKINAKARVWINFELFKEKLAELRVG